MVELLLGGGVHGGGRLIEDQQLRLAGEGAGDEGALLLPDRESPDPPIAEAGHVGPLQRPLDRRAIGRARTAEGPEAREAAHPDDFGDGRGKLRVEGGEALRHVADPPAFAEARGVLPEEAHVAARGAEQPEDDIQQRALPRPVRPDQPQELATVHRQVHPRQGRLATVAEADVAEFDEWFSGCVGCVGRWGGGAGGHRAILSVGSDG